MKQATSDNPMTRAVEAGDAAAVERLCVEQPRLVNTFDGVAQPWGEELWLPLHRAALRGDARIAALLLDHGAHPDARTRFQTPERARATALHWAAWTGHVEVASLLLDLGAFLAVRDFEGSTPLGYACLNGQPATARLLIERGADYEARDDHGQTPLMLSVLGQTTDDVALLLIDAGVDVNATNPRLPSRVTALHGCVDAGVHRLSVARRLLDAGADRDVADPESKMTPLEVARMFVRMGHAEYARYVELLSGL